MIIQQLGQLFKGSTTRARQHIWRVLHPGEKRLVDYVNAIASPGQSILDISAGGTKHTEYYRADLLLNEAQLFCSLNYADNSFDMIALVHQAQCEPTWLKDLSRVCEPGGDLLILGRDEIGQEADAFDLIHHEAMTYNRHASLSHYRKLL